MNIVYKRPDGGVSITHLTAEAGTPEQHDQLLRMRGDVPNDWVTVATHIELPTTREWREAWAWTTSEPIIDIDIDKAADVTKNRLRQVRGPLLKDLDVKFQRALEDNDLNAQNAVITEKKRLRDITKSVHTGLTLDEMKAIIV